MVRDPAMLLVYVLVYGTANGAKEALDAIVWADFFGRRAAGAIRGLSRPLVVGSGAVGVFAGGLGYDLTGSYTTVVLILAGLALLGVPASTFAMPPRAPALLVESDGAGSGGTRTGDGEPGRAAAGGESS
jgi:hypothetical protein